MVKDMWNEISFCDGEEVRGDKSTLHNEKNYSNLYYLLCVV